MYLNDIGIADHLAYRYYGDSLLIVMNWKTQKIHLLRDRALEAWKCVDNNRSLKNEKYRELSASINNLVKLGLLTTIDSVNSQPNNYDTVSNIENNANQQIINQWAARNSIPINGSFEVTAKCNLRCVHCYSIHQNKHNLSTGEVLKIVDDLKANGNLTLTLTGGEFFSRPDYRDILRYLCDHKFAVRINTNGTYINDRVIQDIESFPQLSRIHVSLYSANPQVHDGITKVRGSFQKTLQALHRLKETDKIIRINCSVMNSNIESYRSVKGEIGDKLGIPVRYDSRLVAMDDGNTENLTERASDFQIEQFYNWMLDTQIVDSYTLLHPKRQVKSDQIGLCSAGFSYFAVGDDGNLYPCFQLRAALGNLLENDFATLWNNSSFLNRLRYATNETLVECNTCTMKPVCNLCIGMSHLEDGDVFGKSTECCRDAGIRYQIAVKRGIIDPRQMKGGESILSQ